MYNCTTFSLSITLYSWPSSGRDRSPTHPLRSQLHQDRAGEPETLLVTRSWNAPETVQFTIGLDLSKVFRWLKLSPFHQRSGILEKAPYGPYVYKAHTHTHHMYTKHTRRRPSMTLHTYFVAWMGLLAEELLDDERAGTGDGHESCGRFFWVTQSQI